MQKRKRAAVACEFCRRRKLGCDNGQPKCSACDSRGIECQYAQHDRRPRASRATIEALEEENRRLRASRGVEPSPVTSQPRSYTGPVGPTTDVGEGAPQISESHVHISATGNSSFRGPTSTLYDIEQAPLPQVTTFQSQLAKDEIRNALVANSLKQRQRERLYSIRQTFDFDGHDPDLVLHLLNIHWNRQHHNLLMVYRPLFMRDMACGGPYFSKMLLNSILFAASKFSPRADVRSNPNEPSTAGWQYRQRVKALLGDALDESTIPTIQALITVASSIFAIGDDRSTSWIYSGTAFRMIVDLGLHVDCADLVVRGSLAAEDLECRRRVFWGAFIFDKIHSMYQGRPVTLQGYDTRVPIEFLDEYEELEMWSPQEDLNNAGSSDYPLPNHPGCPMYSVTTFSALCRLSIIMDRIMDQIYSVHAQRRTIAHAGNLESHPVAGPIGTDLHQWSSSLDTLLKFDPWRTELSLPKIPNPTILSLHCMHHLLIIVLYRPLLSDNQLAQRSAQDRCLALCLQAALKLTSIIQCYAAAFTVRRAPYFIAYCAFVAATILVRVLSRDMTDQKCRERLTFCLTYLRDSEKVNAGVSKANMVIKKLMARSGIGSIALPQQDHNPYTLDLSWTRGFVWHPTSGLFTSRESQDERSEQESGGLELQTLDADALTHRNNSHVQGPYETAPGLDDSTFHDMIFGLHGDLLDQWINLSPTAGDDLFA